MKVTTGQNVNVHYKGTLSDGTEFDNSRIRGQLLSFEVGSGRMIPGFNDAVVGMSVGEVKSVTIPPDNAYGPRNEQAVQPVPKLLLAKILNLSLVRRFKAMAQMAHFWLKL